MPVTSAFVLESASAEGSSGDWRGRRHGRGGSLADAERATRDRHRAATRLGPIVRRDDNRQAARAVAARSAQSLGCKPRTVHAERHARDAGRVMNHVVDQLVLH
jgi:hypothetical protein